MSVSVCELLSPSKQVLTSVCVCVCVCVCVYTHMLFVVKGISLFCFDLSTFLSIHTHSFQILDSSFEITQCHTSLTSLFFFFFLVIPGHCPLHLDYHNTHPAGLPISFPKLGCNLLSFRSYILYHSCLGIYFLSEKYFTNLNLWSCYS